MFYPIKYDNWEKMSENDKPYAYIFGKRALDPIHVVECFVFETYTPKPRIFLNKKFEAFNEAPYDL